MHDGGVLGYSRASSSASLIASTAAASSPSARASKCTLATFPALTPTAAATCRWLRPSASFWRRISLSTCISVFSVGIPAWCRARQRPENYVALRCLFPARKQVITNWRNR